eukprot:TRINITY_DN10214_c0_g1_i1.p1 TRINITY_DN10214_c0_g1~~TRINITY_DN10214_c0_g1_i1.p1  ORF type:complete len:733 (+),score=370.29 TRINITY_DN10214_c0_g1_i1:77-2200(+)
MSDEKRFSRIRSDPMFRKVNGAKNTKLVVDERFEGMFSDPSFNTQYQVDKYGRSVRDSTSNDIKKYYRLDKRPREEPVEEEEGLVDDEGPLPDVDEEGPFPPRPSSSVSGPPVDDEIAPFVWDEVSSDEEEGVDIDSDEEAETEEQEVIPAGDETRRFAVLNLDWDIIRSVDLLALFQSSIPSGSGFVKKVSILPSLFGLERIEREKREGPPKEIWKKSGTTTVQYSGRRGEEEGDIDMDELKKYELSRMKYYFAVVEFDSAKTALHVYRECDGMEVESTSNALDLRFIPDDQVFEPQQLKNIKDQATEVPSNYEMVKEYTRALQQTRFDLSWDRDDPERHMVTRARLTPDQIDAIDFRSYLACSSDEDEDDDEDEKKDRKKKKKAQKELPGKDAADSTSKLSAEEEKKRKRAEKKKKIRERYAGLLKSITSSVSRDANEIEVTFTPGLIEDAEEDTKSKKDKKDKKDDLNVFQTELQKKRDRRRQASSSETKESPKELAEDQPFSDDEIPDDFFDEDFGASQKKSGSTSSSSAVSKTSTRKRLTEEEKEAERKKKAELELLLLDRKELASSTKGAGKSEKNMDSKKKKKKKGKDEKEKRIVGVEDERFSELYTRPGLFPLDPTNPKYKPDTAKQIIQKRATVQKSMKESAVPDASRASRSWGSSSTSSKDQTEGEKEDLMSLVASVKRKTREFEGVSDRVAKRPRN